MTTNNNDHPVYIPAIILHNKKLTAMDKLVYGRVFGLANRKGYCYASNDYLSEGLGVGKDSVKKSLLKMYKLGLLRYELIRTNKKEVSERHIYPVLGVGENSNLGRGKGRLPGYPTSINKEDKEDNGKAKKISAKQMQKIKAEVYSKVGKPMK